MGPAEAGTPTERTSADASLVFVRDHELVEADLPLLGVAHALKELLHQAAKSRLPHRIEVVLSVAASFDQSGHPQQGQVMADRRLALAQPVAQCGDMQLALSGEVHENSQ